MENCRAALTSSKREAAAVKKNYRKVDDDWVPYHR
jgi:hypothetical protein